MTLPACFTKFDAADAEIACRPRRYYEVIMSRPAGGVRVSETEIIAWSHVPPVRCVITREGIEAQLQEAFRICILREFDELPT